MAVNINQAFTKQLVTLPGIGTKFADTIVSLRTKKGTVRIDDFHEFPALQTKLNELNEKGLISIEYAANLPSDQPPNGSEQATPPKYKETGIDPMIVLVKQMQELGKIMQVNTVVSGPYHMPHHFREHSTMQHHKGIMGKSTWKTHTL